MSAPDAVNISAGVNDLADILIHPVSVLMPIFNEREVVEIVVEEWAREVFAFLPDGSEMLFDDASDDGTSEILEQLKLRYPFIKINRAVRDGFDRASKRLYAVAKCQLIFFTDSDGQYLPADFWKVSRLMGHMLPDGPAMVHGYKLNRHDPFYRIVGSAFFNKLAKLVIGTNGHDINSAFRLIRREYVDEQVPKLRHVPMLLNSELYIRIEKAGYRIIDVPITHRERPIGESRSLPLKSFFKHGWHAACGIFALQRELSATRHAKRGAALIDHR